MARIRPMEDRDVADVVRLHRAAMGNSLWAKLGDSFLGEVYKGLLDHPDFLAFVYQEDGRVRGFIAGSSDGPRMLSEVRRRRAGRLALATVRGLVRKPRAVKPLMETFRYFQESSGPGDDTRAESMFCSFEPNLRGKKISGLINKVLFDELARRGHRHVKITTEDDNEGAVRQLTSWGFERVGAFRFYGKPMLVWRLDLLDCERVDHPQRKRT
jgi:ribosomal protein S18 acetylase RimI-like enzyme